ncbi:MAG: bifunctional diaminohydroxyphosphoribosylaminopyrimidine deaminase/5-amino-6-(5-phosphoribosylamino)uracil reductase RibD [Brevinema sp.]
MQEFFMKRAIEIAQYGFVSPNPRVGAVLTQNDKIIAEGYHQSYGDAHAEINLFHSLPKDFSFYDTELYVSLEPCSHYGKTPPCAKAIIERGIKKVYVASLDPNPLVSGKGVQILRESAIDVTVGLLEEEAKKINEAFFKFMLTNRPFILLKSAMSLDGKICTHTGQSKWISSEESRREVHRLRSQYTAIMVGINTVLSDDPVLTSRIENGRNPIRIIIDSTLRTPLFSKIVQSAQEIPVIIVTKELNVEKYLPYQQYGVEILCIPSQNNRIDLNYLAELLGQRGIDSIMLEGGAELAYSALESKIIDKVQLYYAPIILGSGKSFVSGLGVDSLDEAFILEELTARSNSKDLIVEAYIKK